MKPSVVTVFCEQCDKPVDRNASATVFLAPDSHWGNTDANKVLLDGYYCTKWCLKKRIDK